MHVQDSSVDTSPELIKVLHINDLIINQNDNSTYNISINEPIELDFMSKQQVFDIRKKYAAMYPTFIHANYTPSDIVFGRIEDNKPWWGLIGQNYYGPGQHSIDGLSEETRFINNPLLIFTLDSQFGIATVNLNGPNLFPKPISINFNPSQRTITAVYDISGYNIAADNFLMANAREHFKNSNEYQLSGLNARDFGYNFAYADSEQNIAFDDINNNLTTDIQPIQDFLHTGGSCEYPGGCNNGSPRQTYFEFKTLATPAKIGIRLWKQMPRDKYAPADLYYIVIVQ